MASKIILHNRIEDKHMNNIYTCIIPAGSKMEFINVRMQILVLCCRGLKVCSVVACNKCVSLDIGLMPGLNNRITKHVARKPVQHGATTQCLLIMLQ